MSQQIERALDDMLRSSGTVFSVSDRVASIRATKYSFKDSRVSSDSYVSRRTPISFREVEPGRYSILIATPAFRQREFTVSQGVIDILVAADGLTTWKALVNESALGSPSEIQRCLADLYERSLISLTGSAQGEQGPPMELLP